MSLEYSVTTSKEDDKPRDCQEDQDHGESDLIILLQNIKPILNHGSYVFCTIPSNELSKIIHNEIIGFFRESPSTTEDVTLIVNQEYADKFNLKYSSLITAWITLKIHSSLEAVGLTAAFSTALTKANISCNTIAGYYHDHIFVPIEHATKAMNVLEQLSKSSYNN